MKMIHINWTRCWMLALVLFQSFQFVSLAQWTSISTDSAPGKRFGAASVYCPERDSMLIFSGSGKSTDQPDRYFEFSDLWEFTFSDNEWRAIPQSGTRPSGRMHATLNSIPSAAGTCGALLVGGAYKQSESSTSYASSKEVFELVIDIENKATWVRLSVNDEVGPSYRSHHRMVSRRDKYIFVGGMRFTPPTNTVFNDMWEFTLGSKTGSSPRDESTWTSIPRTDDNAVWIEPRYSFALALTEGDAPSDDTLVVFGGITYSDSRESDVLGDIAIYHFGSKQWRIPEGLKLSRGSMHGMISEGRFFTFGGRTIVRVSNGVYKTYVFQSLLVTDLADNPTGEGLSSPSCTTSEGKTGLWCNAFVLAQDLRPFVRFDYSMIQRGEQMVIYGGLFKDPLDDMWSLNVSSALDGLVIAEPDNLDSNGDLASTVYFMIAILSMMVICFMVFVVSLKRHRNGQPIFITTINNNRPRIVGARSTFIESLPLKTYSKTAPQEGSESITASGDDLHNMCAICLADYEEGESLRILPCNHFFHASCVDQWLTSHNACPMCKAMVDPDPLPDNYSVPEAVPGTSAANPSMAATSVAMNATTTAGEQPTAGEIELAISSESANSPPVDRSRVHEASANV